MLKEEVHPLMNKIEQGVGGTPSPCFYIHISLRKYSGPRPL